MPVSVGELGGERKSGPVRYLRTESMNVDDRYNKRRTKYMEVDITTTD